MTAPQPSQGRAHFIMEGRYNEEILKPVCKMADSDASPRIRVGNGENSFLLGGLRRENQALASELQKQTQALASELQKQTQALTAELQKQNQAFAAELKEHRMCLEDLRTEWGEDRQHTRLRLEKLQVGQVRCEAILQDLQVGVALAPDDQKQIENMVASLREISRHIQGEQVDMPPA